MESFLTYLFWCELCPVLGKIKNQSNVFGSCFRMLAQVTLAVILVSDFFFYSDCFQYTLIRVCHHLETRSNILKRSKKIEAILFI